MCSYSLHFHSSPRVAAQDAEERRRFNEWRKLNARADELFEAAVRKMRNVRRCPHCKVVIERDGGCDHMTCRQCKCNFCLVCGRYDASNPTSRGDCGTRCSTR